MRDGKRDELIEVSGSHSHVPKNAALSHALLIETTNWVMDKGCGAVSLPSDIHQVRQVNHLQQLGRLTARHP